MAQKVTPASNDGSYAVSHYVWDDLPPVKHRTRSEYPALCRAFTEATSYLRVGGESIRDEDRAFGSKMASLVKDSKELQAITNQVAREKLGMFARVAVQQAGAHQRSIPIEQDFRTALEIYLNRDIIYNLWKDGHLPKGTSIDFANDDRFWGKTYGETPGHLLREAIIRALGRIAGTQPHFVPGG